MIVPYQFSRHIISEFEREKIIDKASDLPDDIKNSVMQMSELPEIENMNRVNKKWHKLIEDSNFIVCRKLLKKLKLYSGVLRTTEQMVQDIYTEYFSNVFFIDVFKPSFKKELIECAKPKPSTKNELRYMLTNIHYECELQQIRKACDILKFWDSIFYALKKNTISDSEEVSESEDVCDSFDITWLNIKNFNSAKELIEMASKFEDWCQQNLDLLYSLEYLDACGINLTALPPEIGLLKNLDTLNLNYNQLTTLPVEIGLLKRLNLLNLNHNHLKKVPKILWKLVNITNVWLSDNQLSTMSSEVKKWKNLKKITLNDNPLISLPDSLASKLKFNVSLLNKINKPNFWIKCDEVSEEEEIDSSPYNYQISRCITL